ncbi:hypothetical protein MESS2_1670050 [Mesorhizobium metallidurans STM 2683]|uniref:Uncharacterized protein n=2 Tax=Mesorhizobium TaxID=68287 RepID=A0A1R3V6A8_9HYPH|nr:hypothetical protein MESS2_1670050 [Mesorhizobium metallidurans STM 2683]SIT54778.1 conserved hypothetical protein [Mesorhizobium prunaredense]
MNKSIVRIISIHILDGPAYSPPGRTVRLMLWYRSLELAFGHQSSSAADWTLIWLPQSERGGNRHRDVSRLSVGAAGLQRLRPSTIG